MSPNPYAAYVFRSTGLHISGFGFLQFFLSSFCDLRSDVGWGVLIDVELHAIGPAAVCERVQRRRVTIQLRFGDERFDLREPAVLVGAEDVPAPRREVT